MKMGFVTKADTNYFPGLKNLVASLKVTNPEIPITVFDCGLTQKERESISRHVHRLEKLEITKYSIKDIDQGRFTNSIYAAMYLDKVDYEIVFHLDADIVVLENLSHVFSVCAKKDFVGTSDFPPLSLKEQIINDEVINNLKNQHPYVEWERRTFNGGVFCVTQSFFSNQLLPNIKKFSSFHKKLKTNDQALLNLAYAFLERGDFYDIGIHYNFRPYFSRAPEIVAEGEIMTRQNVFSTTYNEEEIKILHFIREPKPWMKDFDQNSLFFRIWNQFSGLIDD